MDDERRFYEAYIGSKVKIITKETNGKSYFYNGALIAVLEKKIVLNDRKVGQIMIDLEEIKSIEPTEKEGDF